MKKVLVVGTVGLPACYGGFESLVENLTNSNSDNIVYEVFCSSKSYKKKLCSHNGAKLLYLPVKANGIQSILYDVVSLIVCLFRRPDVVLILGVSGCCFLPIFRLFSKSRIVTNIDGLEWQRDKWGYFVKIFLKFSEKMAVLYSDTIVTDNQAITNYVKKEYNLDSETIAYGGDHALREISACEGFTEPFALGLCRIEPENNVELILESFSRLEHEIKFVGNWDNSDFGRRLRKKYSKYRNISLLDPIYDLDELYILRNASSLYLHGHSAGGTNPSLVEMMHFGCPILAFDCNFNRYSTDNKAHYFKDTEELSSLVRNISHQEKLINGENMLRIAREKYSWSEIAKRYENVY